MDFKNQTYKTKNKILLIGSILFLLFAYNFVISKTVDLYRTNKNLNAKINAGLNAPVRQKALEEKLNKFNNSLNKYITDSLKNRDYILGIVSDFCSKNKLTLREFPEPVITQEKDFEIETNIVVAEGDYLNLLKLLYEIEQNNSIARPASVNFEKKFDYKRKRDVLTLTLYLQNIRTKVYENNN